MSRANNQRIKKERVIMNLKDFTQKHTIREQEEMSQEEEERDLKEEKWDEEYMK